MKRLKEKYSKLNFCYQIHTNPREIKILDAEIPRQEIPQSLKLQIKDLSKYYNIKASEKESPINEAIRVSFRGQTFDLISTKQGFEMRLPISNSLSGDIDYHKGHKGSLIDCQPYFSYLELVFLTIKNEVEKDIFGEENFDSYQFSVENKKINLKYRDVYEIASY